MKVAEDNVQASKAYVYGILWITGFLLLGIMGMNWFINPFGIWQSPRIHGINEFIDVSGYVRLYKMSHIPRLTNTQVYLLGASSVFKACYPARYFEISGLETYNAGFSGARISEIKSELEHAIKFNRHLKEVVLGLNWYMFHKTYEGITKEFPKNQVGVDAPDREVVFSALLSWDAVKRSIQTVQRNLQGIQYNSVDADGKMNESILRKEYQASLNLEQFAVDTVVQIPMFRNYELSKLTIDEYAEIVALCEMHGIKLQIYINPVHGIFLESIYKSGGWESFEDWKRCLVEIHPFYDFSHYSQIGSEAFSTERRYWRNTQHPMPLTGALVLQRLAGGHLPNEVGDFGFLVTKNNVESVLKNERRLREQWRENNRDVVQFVNTLVGQY